MNEIPIKIFIKKYKYTIDFIFIQYIMVFIIRKIGVDE